MRWIWHHQGSEVERCLSPEEDERAAGFAHAAARRSFIQARSTLRRSLAERLSFDPLCLEITIDPGGKPRVAGCEFNVSHSGDWIFLGLNDEQPIGVDVEQVRTRSIHAIAERFYSEPEQARLAEADDAPFVFAEIWTAKESFLKALGQGITRPLNEFDVSTVNHDDWIEVEGVRIRSVWAPEGYAAAVAVVI